MPPLAAPPAQEPEYVDARHIGAIIGFSPWSVLYHARAGTIPRPIRVGKKMRWNLKAFRRWLASKEAEGLAYGK